MILKQLYRKRVPVIICLSLSFLAMMCPKIDDTNPKNLPPITQNGANTFGCMVNNDIYEPSSNGLCDMCYPFFFNYNSKPPTLSINGDDFNNANKYARIMGITVSGCDTVGHYKLGVQQYANSSYAYIQKYNSNFSCETNNSDTSYVDITRLDTVRKIVSGTFSFGVRDSANNLIRIAKGRFDYKYPFTK